MSETRPNTRMDGPESESNAGGGRNKEPLRLPCREILGTEPAATSLIKGPPGLKHSSRGGSQSDGPQQVRGPWFTAFPERPQGTRQAPRAPGRSLSAAPPVARPGCVRMFGPQQKGHSPHPLLHVLGSPLSSILRGARGVTERTVGVALG